MSKLTLDDIASSYASVAKLNQNFEEIQEAFDNTLSRDGTGPNHMDAELDMNSNRIINLPSPSDPLDAVRLQDLTDAIENIPSGPKGDPGGSVDDIGLFVDADGLDIPSGVNMVRTSGYSSVGVGQATYSTRVTGSPHAKTFTAADGRVFELLSDQDGWSIAAYGAVSGGDATANQEAIQEAIYHALWLERHGYGTQAVFVDPGKYTIDSPLHVFIKKGDFPDEYGTDPVVGNTYDNVSINIHAPARGYVGGRATQIRSTSKTLPAVMIAKARSVNIRNISFFGPCLLYQPSAAEMVTSHTLWSNIQLNEAGTDTEPCMSTFRNAPGCGIVIDPFSATIDDGGNYPFYDSYYCDNNASSSNVIIENVEVQGFYAGIVCSPSVSTQIGDSVTIRDCNLSYNTYPLSTCQSQTRAIHAENIRINGSYIAINNNQLGNTDGSFPHVKGLNVTWTKYLFSGKGSIGSGSISESAVESTFALGEWVGNFALDIVNCHIKLLPPPYFYNTGNVDWHLYAQGPVNFNGGYFGFYNNVPIPASILGGGMVSFKGTVIDTPPICLKPRLINYDIVPLRYHNGGDRFGVKDLHTESTEGLLAQAIDAFMPYGGRVQIGSNSFGSRYYRNLSGAIDLTLESSVTITVNGSGGATFTTANPDRYKTDEWLITTTNVTVKRPNIASPTSSSANTILGRVASVVGTTITLDCVPLSLTTGSYNVTHQSLRPFRRRAYGAVTSGSNIITNVSPADHGYRVGDRLVAGNGIVAGSYVTAINVTTAGAADNTITLSQNANATGNAPITNCTLVLEDAPEFATPTGVTFQGDFYRNTSPLKDANNMVLIGWRSTTSGAPGTLEPQYVSAVSPAT